MEFAWISQTHCTAIHVNVLMNSMVTIVNLVRIKNRKLSQNILINYKIKGKNSNNIITGGGNINGLNHINL